MDSKQLLQNWINAFQACDPEAVAECYADDAVNLQVAIGEPDVGKEAIRAGNNAFFAAFPDAWSRVENLIGDGDRAAWEWIGGGTWTGEFAGHSPSGKSFEIRGCGFFRFRDGKIIEQHGYWDKLSWFSQIGLPTE
ncbi:MAG TPA: ester cyclase [Pyrinomonadaceae bacterium]|nr:ester cyclase [Chloracidobacterium sp.]HBE83567.1 polyketide cyclase [Blastocatellia bacterium]HRJ88147.1 ester cyclase [Pyrinomonadaceae bacterium]HRK49213.1 ester cyclase [Pyrinomonadaceae bacterium]